MLFNFKSSRHSLVSVGVVGISIFMLVGCAPSSSSQVTHRSTSIHVPKSGTIASMELVNYPGQNPLIKIYEMFYWSHGEKVQAYVTEPKAHDPSGYPILLNCHGGYTISIPKSHMASPLSLAVVAQNPVTNAVTVYPQYRGYAASEGIVHGLYGNAMDAENAIIAVDSLNFVNPRGGVSLVGTSMGGAVVLMIASNPLFAPGIVTAVAISPFAGWDIAGAWYQKNAKFVQNDRTILNLVQSEYGPYNPLAKDYKRESPAIENILSHVLLIQGTKDHKVPWQTVNTLYRAMKKDHKNVTLDLISGGNHALTGRYQPVLDKDIENWLQSLQGQSS